MRFSNRNCNNKFRLFNRQSIQTQWTLNLKFIHFLECSRLSIRLKSGSLGELPAPADLLGTGFFCLLRYYSWRLLFLVLLFSFFLLSSGSIFIYVFSYFFLILLLGRPLACCHAAAIHFCFSRVPCVLQQSFLAPARRGKLKCNPPAMHKGAGVPSASLAFTDAPVSLKRM